MVLSFWLSLWDPLEVLAFISFSGAVSSVAFLEAGRDSEGCCRCLFSCQHFRVKRISMLGFLPLWLWGLAAVSLGSLPGQLVMAGPEGLLWAA